MKFAWLEISSQHKYDLILLLTEGIIQLYQPVSNE